MRRKVILISVDGMRPDGFEQCGHPFAETMKRIGSYTLCARTVYPSVTLPCHMSLFHGVPPERHGTLTNTYVPMVRPVTGLFEALRRAGSVNAMYYGWGPIRDVSRPEDLIYSEFIEAYAEQDTDSLLTDSALSRIARNEPDFVFLYLVETDEKGGHDSGWMSEEYLRRVNTAVGNIRRVWETAGNRYTVIVTADHGGHDRMHGTDLPEDMTIPMFFIGPDFAPGRQLENVCLTDLAPTVAKVMGVQPDRAWEGRPVF